MVTACEADRQGAGAGGDWYLRQQSARASIGGDLTNRTGPRGTTVHVFVRLRHADSIADVDGGDHGVI